jgi:hypothetical protein
MAAAYVGGADTVRRPLTFSNRAWNSVLIILLQTTKSLTTFILAMVLNPEVLRKAQSELDSVVGLGRLPNFEDRESLPYVNALCKEVIRWHPIFPLGVAHWVTQDDIYRGHFIPERTIVIGNAWLVHSYVIEEDTILTQGVSF